MINFIYQKPYQDLKYC